MNEKYKRNVVAYIAMFIRDVYCNVDNDTSELYCYDVVYDLAEKLADKFIGSDYDNSTQSLFECINSFLTDENDKGFFDAYN